MITDRPGRTEWTLERIDLGLQVFGEHGELQFINQTAKRWSPTGRASTHIEQRNDELHGPVWLEHRFQPAHSAVLVLTTDITRRRKAELTLERSEGKFALAFQSSPVGIAISVFDTGKFLAVNDEAIRIHGFTREELIGRTSVELGIIDAETRKELLTEIRSVICYWHVALISQEA